MNVWARRLCFKYCTGAHIIDTMTGNLEGNIRHAVWRGVEEQLGADKPGHGVDHVARVHDLSMRFCDSYPTIDRTIVALASILHDVDDYKLVGREQAAKMTSATEIMTGAGVDVDLQTAVRGVIATMGYSKALRGVRPLSLEGMVVSDADMCDAIGASGIERALTYAISDKGSGVVFDETVWPITNITADQYNGGGTTHSTDSFINHFFEKLLLVPGMMMTEPGKAEAAMRDEVMVSYLRGYFRERRLEQWQNFLEEYIASR